MAEESLEAGGGMARRTLEEVEVEADCLGVGVEERLYHRQFGQRGIGRFSSLHPAWDPGEKRGCLLAKVAKGAARDSEPKSPTGRALALADQPLGQLLWEARPR